MTSYKILYRRPEMSEDELSAAHRYFDCRKSRIIKGPATVIGRYSVWPYYDELYRDLDQQDCTLINTPQQHDFVARLDQWTPLLHDVTPQTWTTLSDIPEGQYVLKGQWKSRKDKWNTHMFAASRRDAIQVYCRLQDDTLIGSDTIYIRQYVPINTLLIGLNDLPVTEEYRFFVLDGTILCGAFYWANYVDDIPCGIPQASNVPQDFLDKIVGRIDQNVRFYTMDVARTQSGDWIVVELNDGQQSGLSCIEPETLYGAMYRKMYNLN